MTADGYQVGDKVPGRILHARYSRYMQRVAAEAPQLVEKLAEVGARFTHHSSIAPTGTISLSLANNASNGIEPSFAHHYFRNVIRRARRRRKKSTSIHSRCWRTANSSRKKAMPAGARWTASRNESAGLFHHGRRRIAESACRYSGGGAEVDRFIDLENGQRAYRLPYENFKDIYLYAYEQGLKGMHDLPL